MGHTPGDAVPEIAQDNKVAVPLPVVRRARPRDEERNSTRDDPSQAGERYAGDEREPVATPRRSYERRGDESRETPGVRASPREPVRDPVPVSRDRSGDGREREMGSRPSPTASPRSDHGDDQDRDVLRRMFRPLTERPSSGDSSRTASPRSEPRSEPRSAAPREPRQAPPPPRAEPRAPAPQPRTAKERDNRR
jgi:hypothetical protein